MKNLKFRAVRAEQGLSQQQLAETVCVSLQTINADEGGEIRLLKGSQGSYFVNLQLVQPYLYVVNINHRKPFSDGQYAVLYRLDLTDMSLTRYPFHTLAYCALSDGNILRIEGAGAGSWGGMFTPGTALAYFSNNLYLSDWEGENRIRISLDQFNEIAGPADRSEPDL